MKPDWWTSESQSALRSSQSQMRVSWVNDLYAHFALELEPRSRSPTTVTVPDLNPSNPCSVGIFEFVSTLSSGLCLQIARVQIITTSSQATARRPNMFTGAAHHLENRPASSQSPGHVAWSLEATRPPPSKFARETSMGRVSRTNRGPASTLDFVKMAPKLRTPVERQGVICRGCIQ